MLRYVFETLQSSRPDGDGREPTERACRLIEPRCIHGHSLRKGAKGNDRRGCGWFGARLGSGRRQPCRTRGSREVSTHSLQSVSTGHLAQSCPADATRAAPSDAVKGRTSRPRSSNTSVMNSPRSRGGGRHARRDIRSESRLVLSYLHAQRVSTSVIRHAQRCSRSPTTSTKTSCWPIVCSSSSTIAASTSPSTYPTRGPPATRSSVDTATGCSTRLGVQEQHRGRPAVTWTLHLIACSGRHHHEACWRRSGSAIGMDGKSLECRALGAFGGTPPWRSAHRAPYSRCLRKQPAVEDAWVALYPRRFRIPHHGDVLCAVDARGELAGVAELRTSHPRYGPASANRRKALKHGRTDRGVRSHRLHR